MNTKHTPKPIGTCRVPMFTGYGANAGFCDEPAYGTQLPVKLLYETRCFNDSMIPFCFGACCPAHGGPNIDEPRVFRDGTDKDGWPMWCAVMPDFINLQESKAGFSTNPLNAVSYLRAAIAKATGETA